MAVNSPWEQWFNIRRRPKYRYEKLRAQLEELEAAGVRGAMDRPATSAHATQLDEREASWPPLGRRFAKNQI